MEDERVEVRIAAAGQRAAQAFGAYMQRVGEQMRPVLKRMHDAMWAAYAQAGKPYGDNLDGLMRWAREVGEVQRLREEADRIELGHRNITVTHEEPTA